MSETGNERQGPIRRYLTRAISITAVLLLVALLAYGVLTEGASRRVDHEVQNRSVVPEVEAVAEVVIAQVGLDPLDPPPASRIAASAAKSASSISASEASGAGSYQLTSRGSRSR